MFKRVQKQGWFCRIRNEAMAMEFQHSQTQLWEIEDLLQMDRKCRVSLQRCLQDNPARQRLVMSMEGLTQEVCDLRSHEVAITAALEHLRRSMRASKTLRDLLVEREERQHGIEDESRWSGKGGKGSKGNGTESGKDGGSQKGEGVGDHESGRGVEEVGDKAEPGRGRGRSVVPLIGSVAQMLAARKGTKSRHEGPTPFVPAFPTSSSPRPIQSRNLPQKHKPGVKSDGGWCEDSWGQDEWRHNTSWSSKKQNTAKPTAATDGSESDWGNWKPSHKRARTNSNSSAGVVDLTQARISAHRPWRQ